MRQKASRLAKVKARRDEYVARLRRPRQKVVAGRIKILLFDVKRSKSLKMRFDKECAWYYIYHMVEIKPQQEGNRDVW